MVARLESIERLRSGVHCYPSFSDQEKELVNDGLRAIESEIAERYNEMSDFGLNGKIRALDVQGCPTPEPESFEKPRKARLSLSNGVQGGYRLFEVECRMTWAEVTELAALLTGRDDELGNQPRNLGSATWEGGA